MARKSIARKLATALGALLLGSQLAAAEPMKCSSESQACLASCPKLPDPSSQRACINTCTERKNVCLRTGCWYVGSQSYCGLLRQ
jgi:hypothetical protein